MRECKDRRAKVAKQPVAEVEQVEDEEESIVEENEFDLSTSESDENLSDNERDVPHSPRASVEDLADVEQEDQVESASFVPLKRTNKRGSISGSLSERVE